MDFSNTNLDSSFLEQLRLTVAYCQGSIPYYAQAWPKDDGAKRFLELPLIDKATVRSQHRGFINPQLSAASVMHTSGTTGEPLLVVRSDEEVNFVNEVLRDPRVAGDSRVRPLGLCIRDNVHGRGPAYRSNILWLGDPSFTPPTLELGRQYLTRDFYLPGCESHISCVFMSVLEMLHFCAFLTMSGFTADQGKVKTVYTTGFPLCPAWSSYISDFWGCEHVNAFSLTEIFGQALSCAKCGQYHWDPFSLVEFIDPITFTPVLDGLATMVITTLFPYTQLMPLVRYNTNDLVWVSRDCPNGIGFAPMGRAENALQLPGGLLIPIELELLEVLASVDWIQRTTPFVLREMDLSHAEAYGMPVVAAHFEGKDTVITAAVRKGTLPTDGMRARLEEGVRQAIFRVFDILKVTDKAFNVRLTLQTDLGHSRAMFGCPTAGIVE